MDLVFDVQFGLPLKAYLFSQCAASGLAAVAGDFCEPDSSAPIVLFHFDCPSEQVLLRLFISDKPHQRAVRSLEWSPPGVERMLLVGVEDGRVFVYSMTDASRDSSVSLNCCVFNEWYCHHVVAPSSPAPLASATWLSPPKQLHWPSTLTQHRFGPEQPCGLEQAFAWSEQNGAESRSELDRLPLNTQEWIRPHTATFAVVTQDSHLTVYWQALAGLGAKLTWHASVRINLGNMRVPAALAHVATSPGGKVHVAVVLHDYPGEHDALEEHVVSTYTQGDLTCTSPDVQPDASGSIPGVAMPKPPLDSRISDGSPVRTAFLRRDELCHRLLLFTQQRERPWQWALRCFSPGGASARGNAVLHSFDIDYAAFGAPDPASLLRQGATGPSSQDGDDSVMLDVALSPDVMLAAVLVVVNKHASVVWVDLRNQTPSAAGGALETCQVLGIAQLPWLPVGRECVRVQFSPNGALLMLLVSHLELTSAMGLVTRRTVLYGLRVPPECRSATAAVALAGVPPQFEPLFVYKRQQEHALLQAMRDGVLSGFQLAWSMLTEQATWDLVRLHKWDCCVRGDGTPLHVCMVVANDMLHATTSEFGQTGSTALDSFKAVALPLLIQPNCSEPAAALAESLAIDVRARRLSTVVIARLDQLGTSKMHNALVSALSSKGHLTAAEATALKDKISKQAPWVRWVELFLLAIFMSLKQWLSSEGREASCVPLMRLLVDEHFTLKILPVLFEALKYRQRTSKPPAPGQAQPWPATLSDVTPDSHFVQRQFPHAVQVLERMFDRNVTQARPSGGLSRADEMTLSVALLENVFPSHGLAHFCAPNTKSMLMTKFIANKASALEQMEKACKTTLPGLGSRAQMGANMALLGLSPFSTLCEPPGLRCRAAALANLKKAPAWSMDLPGWRALNPKTARADVLMHEFYDVDEQVAMGMFRDTTRQRSLMGADAITGVLSDCPSPISSEYTNSGLHGKRGMLDVEALDGSCATNELSRTREEFAAAPQTVSQAVLRSCLASSPLTGAPWKRCRRY